MRIIKSLKQIDLSPFNFQPEEGIQLQIIEVGMDSDGMYGTIFYDKYFGTVSFVGTFKECFSEYHDIKDKLVLRLRK